MGLSNNMAVQLDHTHSTSDRWQSDYSLACGGLPTAIFISPGLHGGTSTISHPRCCTNLSEKLGASDSEPDAVFAHSAYPSPPSTSSNSKRSVPLPCLHADHHDFSQGSCRPSSKPFGGILDSPIVMRHDSLGCHAPISPPPTLPTKTQALPLEEEISLASIPELDDSEFLPFLDTVSLPRDEAEGDQPLSPVSPEWATNGLPSDVPQSPERSFLLRGSCCNMFGYLSDDSTSTNPSIFRPLSPPHELLDLRSSTHGWDLSPSLSNIYIESELDSAISPLPLSPPESPLLKPLDLDTEDAQLPSSPFVRPFSLPDSDDDNIEDQHTHHSLDTQDSFTDDSIPPPPSPSQSPSPLPGTDLEDIFHFTQPPETDFFPYSPPHPHPSTHSLLLINDPNDVPPPRSPSPEPFQLDLSQLALDGCTDPSIQRLCDIRKKSQAAERTARVLEAQALELGGPGVGARWEARQKKKQEKERGREIAAMLRLKLAEKGVRVDDAGSILGADVGHAGGGYNAGIDGVQFDRSEGRVKMKKNVIGSMEQLVARMLLRRNDTSRSLVTRKTEPSHSKSPLSRRVVSHGAGDNMDMEDDDEDDWDLKLRSWPLQ